MKLSTSWINKWLRRTMSDDEIVQALERAGLEIEHYSSSKPIDKKVIVGVIKKVVQHPGADRLHLCEVSTGKETLSIVCGASNVREGLKVAVAQVGSTLPSGDTIKAAKLRGEVSEGMLCSERELALGSDHDGILEMPDSVELGTPLCDIYPADGFVDTKTHANRFDLLSVVGLAREVAAMTGTALSPLPDGLQLAPAPEEVIEQGAEAPRYALLRLSIKPTASPAWMTAALQAGGMRAVSSVVDITNYAMLELGQPLHAFDAAKVQLPISVRHAKAGERLVTLDDVERKLTASDLVIADQTGPIALAGVMGGAATEVSDETTEILLEVATFDAPTVRKMALRHGLRSEASARMERSLPVQLQPVAAAHAVKLFEEHAGAKLLASYDQLNVWPWTQRIGLRLSTLNRSLGFDITAQEAVAALGQLGIGAVSFDIAKEAKKHLGKPYIWGASFKKNGTDGFDCSYLTDYLYSLIGRRIGYTSLAQYEIGRPVDESELLPGDILFYQGPNGDKSHDFELDDIERGQQAASIVGHYYLWDDAEQKYIRHESKTKQLVGHDGLYIGGGKVIQAAHYEYVDGKWRERAKPGVVETSVEDFTANPGYLGARRFVDHLGDYLSVPEVPWWRPDIKLDADLIEEIVRVLGYDRVPSRVPQWRPQTVRFDRTRAARQNVVNVLVGAGLFEVLTYSFVAAEQLAEAGLKLDRELALKNPLSSEQGYLRSSLLPSHLAVLERNRHYAKELGFFELSKVFIPHRAGAQPNEPMRLGLTVAAPRDSYRRLKGILDRLAWELGLELIVKPAAAPTSWAEGRYARVWLGDQDLGNIGQLDPAMLGAHKITSEVSFLELDIEPLILAATPRQYAGLDRFPTVQRDVSAVVAADVRWSDVAAALGQLTDTRLGFVSDYTGDDVPDGHKVITLRVTLAHADRTPTDAEAADLEHKVWDILKHRFKASPR